jgi:hypothetical protein
MADSATNPTHEGTGHFDEKTEAPAAAPAPVGYQSKPKNLDDDEDEDIDALIEDLESQDGHQEDEEEEESTPGGKKASILTTQCRYRLGSIANSSAIASRSLHGSHAIAALEAGRLFSSLGAQTN